MQRVYHTFTWVDQRFQTSGFELRPQTEPHQSNVVTELQAKDPGRISYTAAAFGSTWCEQVLGAAGSHGVGWRFAFGGMV